ncbi:hypothetical protein C4J84_2837 [Pseudomonas sp. R11-23-07]|nr:hypothetical protein C4J84_2837 [Pseudomonas sp. R11-23-07]
MYLLHAVKPRPSTAGTQALNKKSSDQRVHARTWIAHHGHFQAQG